MRIVGQRTISKTSVLAVLRHCFTAFLQSVMNKEIDRMLLGQSKLRYGIEDVKRFELRGGRMSNSRKYAFAQLKSSRFHLSCCAFAVRREW